MQDPDWTLAERIGNGDDRAFDELMARFKDPVLAFVYRLTGDAAEAEDIAQEVFVRAYGSLKRRAVKPGSARFSTWLFQVARHAALDALRRRRRRPVQSLDALEAGGRDVAGPERRADEKLAASETARQVAEAVARLPEEQRTALLLSEYEDLSDAEIGAVLKVSRKSVESLLYRARHFLRRRLAFLRP